MTRLNLELNILYLAHRVVSGCYCRAAGSTVFPCQPTFLQVPSWESPLRRSFRLGSNVAKAGDSGEDLDHLGASP